MKIDSQSDRQAIVMAVDIFGGSRSSGSLRGPRGPQGVPGKRGESGIDTMCIWFPNTLLKRYRQIEESLCLLLRNLDADVVRDKRGRVTQWKSRCLGEKTVSGVAKSAKSSGGFISKVADGKYALEFDNNVYYTSERLNFVPQADRFTYVSICMTFKTASSSVATPAATAVGDQVLISNYRSNTSDTYREIKVDGQNVYIVDVCGDESTVVPIQYDTARTWTTLFVEWFHDVAHHGEKSRGYYTILDGTTGEMVSADSFKCTRTLKALYGISIGARFDGTHALTGVVSAMEVYISRNVNVAVDGGDGGRFSILPDKLRNLITKDHKMTLR